MEESEQRKETTLEKKLSYKERLVFCLGITLNILAKVLNRRRFALEREKEVKGLTRTKTTRGFKRDKGLR